MRRVNIGASSGMVSDAICISGGWYPPTIDMGREEARFRPRMRAWGSSSGIGGGCLWRVLKVLALIGAWGGGDSRSWSGESWGLDLFDSDLLGPLKVDIKESTTPGTVSKDGTPPKRRHFLLTPRTSHGGNCALRASLIECKMLRTRDLKKNQDKASALGWGLRRCGTGGEVAGTRRNRAWDQNNAMQSSLVGKTAGRRRRQKRRSRVRTGDSKQGSKAR